MGSLRCLTWSDLGGLSKEIQNPNSGCLTFWALSWPDKEILGNLLS